MAKIALLTILFVPCFLHAQQTVTIGGTELKSDAVLYLVPNGNQGLLLPVINNINNFTPSDPGMLVFNSADSKVYYWDGSQWIEAGGGGTGSGDPSSTNEIQTISFDSFTNILSLTEPGQPDQTVDLSSLIAAGSGDLLSTNNLSDVADVAAARTNLGLQTLATQSAVSGGGGGDITDNTIADVDISNVAAINVQKLDFSGTSDGQVLQISGGIPVWSAAGGSNDAQSLQGTPISSPLNPTNGQVLKWDGANWTAGSDDVGGGGAPTLSDGQLMVGNGASNSAAGVAGDLSMSGSADFQINADAVTITEIGTAGLSDGNKILTTDVSGNPQWELKTTVVGGISNLGGLTDVTITTPTAGDFLEYNGSNWVNASDNVTTSTAATNDITGTFAAGFTIAANAVGSGNILDGTIADTDISTTAGIAVSKLAPPASKGVLTTDGSTVSWLTEGNANRVFGTDLSNNLVSRPVVLSTSASLAPDNSGIRAAGLASDANLVSEAAVREAIDASSGGGFSTLDAVPRGDGTGLVTSNIVSNGTQVGIGALNVSYAFNVSGESNYEDVVYFSGNAGTSGDILVSDGTAGPPTWTNPGTLGFASDLQGAYDGGGDVTMTTGNNIEFRTTTTSQIPLFIREATGTVGIGTNAPTGRFEVYGSNTDPAFQINATDVLIGDYTGTQFGTHLYIDPEGAGNFQFLSGNVGIGTTTPNALLEVSGTGFINSRVTSTTGDAAIDIFRTGNSNIDYRFFSDSSDDALKIQSSSDDGTSFNPIVTISETGQVSATSFIGNGSGLTGLPSSPWTLQAPDVYYTAGNVGIGTGSFTASDIIHIQGSNSGTNGPGVFMKIQNDVTGTGGVASGILFDNYVTDNAGAKGGLFFRRTGAFGVGDLLFSLNDDAGSASNIDASDTHVKMIVQNSGEVGIGTTTPAFLLDLEKTLASNTDAHIRASNPSNTTGDHSGIRLAVGPTWAVHLQTELNGNWLEVTSNNGTPYHRWNATSYFPGTGGTGFLQGTGAGLALMGGDVGVGTTTPARQFEIFNSSSTYLRISGTGAAFASGGLELNGTGTLDWRIQPSLGILTFSQGDVDGTMTNHFFMNNNLFSPVTNGDKTLGASSSRWSTVFATNGTINTSDKRLKNNIEDIKYGLNQILSMRPVSYKWNNRKTDTKTHLGLIAQEVQRLIPEVIDIADDDQKTLGMSYTELIPVTIKAIQEQQVIIDAQQREIDELKAMLARSESDQSSITSELKELKAQMARLSAILESEARRSDQ